MCTEPGLNDENRTKGLSTPAVLAIGLILSLAILLTIWGIHFFGIAQYPTVMHAERTLRRGRYQETIALVQQMNEKGSESSASLTLEGKAWFALAVTRQREERWKDFGTDPEKWLKGPEIDNAMTCLRKAVSIAPNNLDSRYWLGLVCKELGWFHEAETHFEIVMRNNPKHIESRIALSSILTSGQQYREAETMLQRGFQIDPSSAEIAKNLGFLYRFYIQNPESAMVWLNRYLNFSPEQDRDINVARNEVLELESRYPEFLLKEKSPWREKKRRFTLQKPHSNRSESRSER